MKLTFNLDSTSLGSSGCILNYIRTVIGDPAQPELGAYKSVPKASMIYGVAVHKYIDTMYKTGGYIPAARAAAEKAFNVPKIIPERNGWLGDPKHLITTCFNVWSTQCEEPSNFEVIMIPGECWWCKGRGHKTNIPADGTNPPNGALITVEQCQRCSGTGKATVPATEITFKIPFYEDEYIKVFLCGTEDRVGKYHNGYFVIRDWKTTGAYNKDEYLEQYDLSRQLRMYTLACKLMAKYHPESILGKIGATKMGAQIDAVFLKSKPNETEYESSRIYQFDDREMTSFQNMLWSYCEKISHHVKHNYYPKEGIINGACEGKWGKCGYWYACKSNENVSEVLLNRDFKRVIYDPLHFNE